MRSTAQRALVAMLLVAVFAASSASGQQASFEIVVDTGKWNRTETPVCVDVKLPAALSAGLAKGEVSATVTAAGGAQRVGQVEALPEGNGAARIWFAVSELKAGQSVRYTAVVTGERPPQGGFEFKDEPGKYLDMLLDGRPVTRLMYEWDPKRREETYKVFHHVYDPAGKRLITKGAGGSYTHHRGLFIGWNKTQFDGKSYDFWHCGNVRSQLKEIKSNVGGPVFGRSTVVVEWLDPQDKPVVTEERTLTAFRQGEKTILLEWSTGLTSNVGELSLNGDMHHSGFQFRADDEVSKRENETSYIYPLQGVERPNAPKVPWVAMSYALGDSRFTVGHLNHPDNPPNTIYSEKERKYGRFGAFFTYTMKADETLRLKYRLYIVEGATPPAAEAIDARYLDFTDPPKVTAAGK